MDLLTKQQINYIVYKYHKSLHQKIYQNVLTQLTKFITDSNVSDSEINNINFGSYLVYRVAGMPPLLSLD